MPIHILDATVAAQIAAGEVVERPASVVKEMVENALDAGARRINVEVRGGGLREIKVQDDGCGIPANEVETAFCRYATSKLHQADDLWNIHTLGFRGEALPSIASVAQVVCITRTAAEEVGMELRIAGGEIQANIPRGCPVGTSMSVRHLFYNTPVRREYLRSEATEMSAISQIVQQYALAYPETGFTLLLDGRLALQTSGSGDLRDVLVEIYGVDVARQLLPVDEQYGDGDGAISIQGLVSPPGLTRSSRSYIHLFVNRRAIHPRGQLVYVVEDAYHTLLMKGKHPMAVFDIRVAPSAVDVNVHPTKSEVKFRYQQQVHSLLGRAVRQALIEGAGVQTWAEMPTDSIPRRFEIRPTDDPQSSGQQQDRSSDPPAAWRVGQRAWSTQHSRWDVGAAVSPFPAVPHDPHPVPSTDVDDSSMLHASNAYGHGYGHADDQRDDGGEEPMLGADESPTAPQDAPTPHPVDDSANSPAPVDAPSPDTPTADASSPAKLPPLRVVGQVGLTYIVAESPNGMYMIDQHATHERIAYERLMAQRGTGPLDSQELLMAETVTLPADKAELLVGNAEQLAAWGFHLDAWGEGMVRVRAVPAMLALENLQNALLAIADHLAGEGGSTPDNWREAMLITLACHTSVRAGQTLSLDEMRDLLRQLEQCTNPHTCPHGRPLMILLTPGELERQFGRRG